MSSLPFMGRLGASSSSSFVTDSTGTPVAVGQGTGVDAGGTQNIFLGFNGAKSNTGSSNLIAGYAANSESTGSTTGAVILGANAGLVASNSADNVLIGNSAGLHTATASQVVAIGARAFSKNTSGWYNCVVRADSFANTGSSAKNVALGAFSGYQVNTNNSCIMGYQAAYGKDARLSEGLVVIGSQAMYNISSVVNGLSINQFSGFNLTDAEDFLAIGSRSAYAWTSQNSVLAVGHGSAQNAQLTDEVTLLGHASGKNLAGGGVLALGNRAAATVRGSDVTAVGIDALNGVLPRAVTSTVAVGKQSGYGATAADCIYLGNAAGKGANGTGSIFIGHQSGAGETSSFRFVLGATSTRAPLLTGNLDTNTCPYLTVNGALRIQQSSPGSPTAVDDGIVFNKDSTSWQVYVDDSDGLSVRKNGSPVVYFDSQTDLAANLDFTGQHRTAVAPSFRDLVQAGTTPQGVPLEGCVVCSTGRISSVPDKTGVVRTGADGIRVSCALPVVELSTERKDKRCFGVFAGCEDMMLAGARGAKSRVYRAGGMNVVVAKASNDDRVVINSLGEGACWVVGAPGMRVENGDYVCTSDVLGLVEAQEDDVRHSYTVAKLTMSCDFDKDTLDHASVAFVFEVLPRVACLLACSYAF
jgi:hypothetical protein